jgi:hypothetical protein
MKITYHGQEGDKLKVSINDGDILLLTTDELYTLAAIDEKQTQEELDWQSLRNQAAIAAMQGVMNFFGSIDYNRETIARLAVEQADALIEELRKEK